VYTTLAPCACKERTVLRCEGGNACGSNNPLACAQIPFYIVRKTIIKHTMFCPSINSLHKRIVAFNIVFKMFSVLKCFVRIIPPQNVLRTATVTNMLRLRIHISSCQTTLSYFETRCDTAMISDSLVGRLNISAQQIMVKVGSHEDVIRSTSMPAVIPHKSGLSRVSHTSTSSEHVRTSGSNARGS